MQKGAKQGTHLQQLQESKAHNEAGPHSATTASVTLQVAHEAADTQALIHTQKWEFVQDAFQLLQATQHTFEEVRRKAPVLAPPMTTLVDGQRRAHASRPLPALG